MFVKQNGDPIIGYKVERNCVIESTTTTGWWFMWKD